MSFSEKSQTSEKGTKKVIYGVLANSTVGDADLETTDREKSRSSPSDNFISVPLRKPSTLVLGGYHYGSCNPLSQR